MLPIVTKLEASVEVNATGLDVPVAPKVLLFETLEVPAPATVIVLAVLRNLL